MTIETKIPDTKYETDSNISVRRVRSRRRDHILNFRSGGLKFSGLGI